MEKIKILELDIDIDAITKATSAFKTELDFAKASLDGLKKSGDTSSRQFVEQQAKVNRLNDEYRVSQRELTKLSSVTDTQNLSIKEARSLLSVVSSQWAKQAGLYGENSKEALALAKTKKQLTDQLKEEEKKTGDTTRNVGNYSEGMKEAIKGTSLFGKELSLVKDVTSAFGGIMTAVKSDVSAATAQITGAAKGTEGLSKAQKAQAIASNVASGALKLFKIALISTGIGAVVVLLGSLVAYFSSTQKGIDAVNKALTPLKVVFQSLFGVLQQVGESLSSLFTLDGIKAFGNGIKDFVLSRIELMKTGFFAIGKILTGDISEGLNDLKGIATQVKDEVIGVVDGIKRSAGELSATMQEAYDRGKRIADLQIQIEEAELGIIQKRALTNSQLQEQLIIAKDTSKSAIERQAAVDEQLRLSKELIKAEDDILLKQIEQLELKQKSNDTSRDELKELEQLKAKRIENGDQLLTVERKNLEVQNSIKKEYATKAKKAQDDAIKDSKAELNLFIAQNKVKAQSLSEEVALAEKVRDKKLEILEAEILAGKKTREEAALDEFNIKQEYLDKQTELVIDVADRELQEFIKNNQSKLEQNKFFSDELLIQEESRLDSVLKKQKEFFQKQLTEGLISQQAYNDAINALNDENEETKKELRQTQSDEAEEKRLIDLENKRAIEDENFLNDFERKTFELDQQRLQEVANAEKTGADVNLINKKFAKFQEQIDREAAIAKIDQQQQTVNQLGGLAQQLFGESKALSSALALADTLLSAQKAYMSQFLPVPDPSSPARGSFQAAIATASGLGRIAKINGIKFESGGLLEVGGQRHSSGGTKFVGEDGTTFEAERGELIGVLNRRAASSFMNYNNSFLSGIGSDTRNYFAAGGIVQRGISSNPKDSVKVIQQTINPDVLAAKLAEAYSSLPPGMVAVEDINQGQSRLSKIISGANI